VWTPIFVWPFSYIFICKSFYLWFLIFIFIFIFGYCLDTHFVMQFLFTFDINWTFLFLNWYIKKIALMFIGFSLEPMITEPFFHTSLFLHILCQTTFTHTYFHSRVIPSLFIHAISQSNWNLINVWETYNHVHREEKWDSVCNLNFITWL